MDDRSEHGARRPGQGMGGSLHAPVRIEQTRDVQRAWVLARQRGQPRERAVEHLAVRVQQHRHVVPRELHTGVAGGAEARVAGQHEHLGAARARQLRATVARPGVDDDELSGRLERVEQDPQLRLGVMEHDDDGERHRQKIWRAAYSHSQARGSALIRLPRR